MLPLRKRRGSRAVGAGGQGLLSHLPGVSAASPCPRLCSPTFALFSCNFSPSSSLSSSLSTHQLCVDLCPAARLPRLLFILSLSSPSFLGLPPALETLLHPSHLACALPCFNTPTFWQTLALEGGKKETKREPRWLRSASPRSPGHPPVRSGCFVVSGNFSLEAGRRIYRSFKCGAYKNTEEWSLRFMHS